MGEEAAFSKLHNTAYRVQELGRSAGRAQIGTASNTKLSSRTSSRIFRRVYLRHWHAWIRALPRCLRSLDKGEANRGGRQSGGHDGYIPFTLKSGFRLYKGSVQFLRRKFSGTRASGPCTLPMIDTQQHALTCITLAGNTQGVYKGQGVFRVENMFYGLRKYPWLLPVSSKCLVVTIRQSKPGSVDPSIRSNLSRQVENIPN